MLMINFGEPDEAVPEKVEPFLERIFLLNAGLEPDESGRQRARQLAKQRAPGLIEEYRRIGGSPLNRQADSQVRRVERVLAERGWRVRAYSAFQFTDPTIADTLGKARSDGVEHLVAVPVYPLCGQSTTVAALDSVRVELAKMDWRPDFIGVSGWHHDAAYERLRADHIRLFADEHGIDLTAPDTLLYFSAHGTPIKYLSEGNRYDRYVEEHSRAIAVRLGVTRHAVGFQNHTNRRIRWTQPDNETCIRALEEKRIIVVPISFMHEQSETLSELDHELRQFTEGLGKEFFRVPVPHDDARFSACLADLVTKLVGKPEGDPDGLARCCCSPSEGIWCTNGARELAPSPYASGVDGHLSP